MMQRSHEEEGGVRAGRELVEARDAGGVQSWEKLLADLCLKKEVTNFEASLLDLVMKERRPLLRAAIVTKADSSEWIVQLGLDSLVGSQYLGAKQLPLPSPSDDTILYYPGPKLTARIRQAEASLSNYEKALLIIQRRLAWPKLKHRAQTEWFRRERDRIVLARWEANQNESSTPRLDEASDRNDKPSTPPPTKRARTEVDAVQRKELAALRQQKIRALHAYNEAKDRAHQALGALAEGANCTVKDLYREFGINERDPTLFL